MPTTTTTTTTEERLRSIQKAMLPWRWAESMRACSLFWVPVNLGSIPDGQREWLLEFFSRLAACLSQQGKLEPEHFMEMRVLNENSWLRGTFFNNMMRESPMMGRTWFPRGKKRTLMTAEEVKLLTKGKKPYDPYEYTHPQTCWFVSRNAVSLRERYLGYGGFTMFFRKPNTPDEPPAVPPEAATPFVIPKFLRNHPSLSPLLADFDLQNPYKVPGFVRNQPGMEKLFSLMDVDNMSGKDNAREAPFRDKSKEIFGTDIPRNIEYEALPFLLPRLASQDFFAQTEGKLRRWFEVFDVYINESTEDAGIIMASKDNLTSVVASIVGEMRGAGYRYWEG
jgi:hypothetical protein